MTHPKGEQERDDDKQAQKPTDAAAEHEQPSRVVGLQGQ